MKLNITFCSAWSIRLWVAVMTFVFLAGCGGGTHRVVTAVEHLDEDRLPTISISHGIAVDPVLTPGSPTIVLGTYGRNQWIGDYDNLTKTATLNLKEMLKRKNISLGTDTSKRLGITVTEAKVNTGDFTWEYYATVKVQLGDGQHYNFSGFNIGAARCIGCNLSQAINEALIQMFQNNDILAYLQK